MGIVVGQLSGGRESKSYFSEIATYNLAEPDSYYFKSDTALSAFISIINGYL